MDMWKSEQRAPFNLNTKVVFPRSAGDKQHSPSKSMESLQVEWSQQVSNLSDF